MNWTAFFFVGLILLGVWFFFNTNAFELLAQKLMQTKQVVEQKKRDMGMPVTEDLTERPSSREATVDEQFGDLRVGEFFNVDLSGQSGTGQEYQVKGVGRHQAQNRSGRTFSPMGAEYPLYVGDGFMMLERPEGWYFFTENSVLLNGQEAAFKEAGEIFSDAAHKQVARSHSFEWGGHVLAILDVGYTMYQHGGGQSHIPNGKLVKYMLAEKPDGQIVYLEQLQQSTIRVWFGQALGPSLEGYVSNVLRAST